MGLDSYWSMPDKSKPPVVELDPPLCGGFVTDSGADSASFRGKVYASLINAVTGVSLYQDEIPNEEIKRMADKLEAFDPCEGVIREGAVFRRIFPPDEVRSLVKSFRYHADLGCTLCGWW
jgi:hypothetical protein